MLTVGSDNFVGTAGNDTFVGNQLAGDNSWTVGDVIDGGAGTDAFNVTQTAAILIPTGVTVRNIETANFLSGGAVTLNTTAWTGLTALNTTNSGAAQTLTAAATTNVTSTVAAQTTHNVSINGGNNVTLTATGQTTGTITVGNTAAPAGAVVISATDGNTVSATQGAIAVTGGTTVTVTTNTSNPVNSTVTQSAVTVTGGASTTEVTVNQRAAATAPAVVGVANGAVVIADVNAASTTAAGTIATVTLNSFGANSTINSSALTTLNLSGKGADLSVTNGALTTPTVTTQALNVNGLTAAGAVTLDTDITTLNIKSSTAASTINSLAAAGATTVNVAGDAALTLTAQTLTAATAINVTNTAGATFGAALGTGVTFTGGAGNDKITLSDSFNKAITMGAGNDTVTVGGTFIGATGSVAAGDGIDTIVMTGAQAYTFDNDATFNTKFTGFEVLSLATGATQTIDMVGLSNISKITTVGASGLTVNNLASGATFTLTGGSIAATLIVRDAAFNPADTVNLVLSNAGGATVAFGTVTAANVETVNISTVDAGTGSDTAATSDVLTLAAVNATTVIVSGNNGLDLSNSGITAITRFDASGVVGNSADDTAAGLAVTFASANTTAAATVTITGGAGNDTLTGNAGRDIINGGAGNDVINGGTNADTITVGVGRDIIVIANNDDNTAGDIIGSGTGAMDVITGFSLVSGAIAGVDLSTNSNFQGATAGGANLNLLNIDLTADDAVAVAGANQAVTVGANATGSGQAAGVTFTVASGILTLGGVGAGTVDTLGEWLVEAAAVAATNGDILAFQFGSDTYVFAENGSADMLVMLAGVTGATQLVEVTGSTTAAAGAILFADIV